jgi:hypothetical protein
VRRYKEIGGLLLLLLLGLAPRLALVTRFPTVPFSDFRSLVVFGEYLRDHGIFSNGWFWQDLNPGLPLALSVVFRIVPGDHDSVARLATAVLCGVLGVVPFLIWRGVFPLWVRMLAGASLAIWPGQVLFSGVVAQDNWVLLPTVGLAALAVRTLVAKEPGQPLIAGLLLATGASIRQEMVVALFPLFLAAAGVSFRAGWRRLAVVGLAAGLPLIALVCYRGVVTGRYTLSTEHGSSSLLGAYLPGATLNGWITPYPYLASVRPDLLRDHKALASQAPALVLQEVLRRPGFQAERILSQVLDNSVRGELLSQYWSMGAEVLPQPLWRRATEFVWSLAAPLRYEMAGIQGLFVAALIVGVRRRSRAILVLAAAVLLKYGLHALIAFQPRYFYPATAMEILAIVLAVYEVWVAPPAGRTLLGTTALAVAVAFALTLLPVRFRLFLHVQALDVDPQRTYHFQLMTKDESATLDCVVRRGYLVDLELPPRWTQSATLRTFQPDPPWGDSASAVCELTGTGAPRPLTLEVLDPYQPGGFPDRMAQRVEVDGAQVLYHDIAKDPGQGWAKIPLGNIGEGTKRKVVVEVKAIHPEPGSGWGSAAATTFQLSRD